jgi:hypothetical protein
MVGTVLFRLRCGHRVWSRWLDAEEQVIDVAIDHRLASKDRLGRVSFGPLVWIEKGHRAYAKRRTVPLAAELNGKPLSPRYRNPLPPPEQR